MAKTYYFGLLAAAMMSYAAFPQRTEQLQDIQSSPVAPESSSQEMYSALEGLCYAPDNMARGELVMKELEAMGMDYSIQQFEREGNNYRNIITKIDVENETYNLAFTAHYDRVDVGCGVIDNGSGVAVVLGMIKDARQNPREDKDITFLFFDAEEMGLLGSKYYVANTDERFDAVFNVDMAAYGDSLMISHGVHYRGNFIPTTESLNQLIIEICDEQSIPYFFTEDKWTDNVSFNAAGLPAASVVRVDSILPSPYPIHNEGDNMGNVDINALGTTKEFMLDILDRY